MTHRSHQTHRGLTLIDTIAAIVILAIAVPPMLWAIREAHLQRVEPTMTSTARWLAVEKLEDIIADRYAPMRGYHHLVDPNYPPETDIEGFPGFHREVAFKETAADLESPGEGYMNITVTVRWVGASGEERTLAITTVVTRFAN